MAIRMTPMASIRAKCRNCSCGSTMEIKNCLCADCALWPYRFGKRPETVAKAAAKKAE